MLGDSKDAKTRSSWTSDLGPPTLKHLSDLWWVFPRLLVYQARVMSEPTVEDVAEAIAEIKRGIPASKRSPEPNRLLGWLSAVDSNILRSTTRLDDLCALSWE